MDVVGYSDRLSARPGETINFMVSCRAAEYEASLVRLIHGDPNPLGPGFKATEIDSAMNGRYRGREQKIHTGSYVSVPHAPPLELRGGFTIQAWIWPTTPLKGTQAVLTKWDGRKNVGFGLFISEDGQLSFQLGAEYGRVEKIESGQRLLARTWYFVAAAYDAARGVLQLLQSPALPRRSAEAPVSEKKTMEVVPGSHSPLLIAARSSTGTSARSDLQAFFNGKIERPRVFGRALSAGELWALREGNVPESARDELIADWDFSIEPASNRATDVSQNGLHGTIMQTPTRGMTGHNWTGIETDFRNAPQEYGAIHFHDDDLDDAAWDRDFSLVVPADLPSGVYAARLKTADAFDYVPFFVRPAAGKPKARILFLVPTLSYMAYGNEHLPSQPGRAERLTGMTLDELLVLGTDYERAIFRYMQDNRLTSLYEPHTDGSGVAYTTRLRPLVNMRPLYRKPISQFKWTHQFNEDLYLLDWLTAMGHDFDVATDEDLHFERADLLKQYRVVLTGSHPEYWTEPMFSALESYLNDGGRLMYLGGNGFYWVTSLDPERPHIIEVRRGEAGVRTWQAEPGEYHHATTGELGGLWRFRGKAPQRVVGVGMTATGGEPARPYRRQPSSRDRRVTFMFEGIGDNEVIGDFGLHMGAAAGWEIDRAEPKLGTPPHALVVASSFGHSDGYQLSVEELWKTDPKVGGTACRDVRADMVYFECPNDGAVFSVGSISYCGSLSFNNYKNNVSKLTHNVLRAFSRETIDECAAAQSSCASKPAPEATGKV
jgi:N,N-dimethylformamidase